MGHCFTQRCGRCHPEQPGKQRNLTRCEELKFEIHHIHYKSSSLLSVVSLVIAMSVVCFYITETIWHLQFPHQGHRHTLASSLDTWGVSIVTFLEIYPKKHAPRKSSSSCPRDFRAKPAARPEARYASWDFSFVGCNTVGPPMVQTYGLGFFSHCLGNLYCNN